MDKNRKLKKIFLFNSNGKTVLSDGHKALSINNLSPEIIKNTLNHFSNPNIPIVFLENLTDKEKYQNFLQSLIKYDFLTDVIKKPLLNDSFTIISNEQYINKIENGLRKLGVHSIHKICINLEQKVSDLFNFEIKEDSTSLLYLPHNPGITFELLSNYHRYKFQKIIIGHVHLNNIWSVFLDPPRTACPNCLISRLIDNMPLFKYIALNDLSFHDVHDNNTELGIQFLLRSISSFITNTESSEEPRIGGFINVFNTEQLTIERERVIKQHKCSCLINTKINMEDLVSNHVGIIRGIGQVPLEQTDPNIVLLSGYISGENSTEGGATDWDWDRCKTRAIGECLERYCWLNYTKNIISSTWSNLNLEQRLPLESFHPYNEEQYLKRDFPYQILKQEELIDWLPVYEFGTNKKVYVPAKILLGNKGIVGPNICPRTSSGVAAGPSVTFATEQAILELIERDTVSRNWLNGGPFLKINEDLLKLSSAYNRCLEVGLDAQVYLLPNKYDIPVIMCRLVPKDTSDIIISYGCSSGKNYISSIDKSILESILMRIYLRDLIKRNGKNTEKHGGISHIRGSQENPPLFLRKAKYISIRDFDKEFTLSNICNLENIYYHDITLDDVYLSNISVVRAWSPNMIGFVRTRELAPAKILNRKVEDLVDGILPFE